ncbi:hypothetical protein D3C79_785690 [compost metagenome]
MFPLFVSQGVHLVLSGPDLGGLRLGPVVQLLDAGLCGVYLSGSQSRKCQIVLLLLCRMVVCIQSAFSGCLKDLLLSVKRLSPAQYSSEMLRLDRIDDRVHGGSLRLREWRCPDLFRN